MNKIISLFSTLPIFLLITCSQPETPKPPIEEFGYLSMSVALQIDALPASGRTEAVSPDDFVVTIHDPEGNELYRWERYVDVPAEVQLPTGSYFVRATNLESPAPAAFDQPWYFGESEVFTIDKEELKTVNVTCTLANCKISFNYSSNVLQNFTLWNSSASIIAPDGEPGGSLQWAMSNSDLEGYFLTNFPIAIEVYLEYTKITNADEKITRTFNHTISDPQPATHYLVNVDASLEDGKIVINITVDDDFETVEIPLGDPPSDPSGSPAPPSPPGGGHTPPGGTGDPVLPAS